jgi:signal transduction histidine kinase
MAPNIYSLAESVQKMAKFTVDTHLFRELGELLVGRDSTALIELVKNSYDADATEVEVHADNLDSTRDGWIQITDNGVGMTPGIFEEGFLRIASRARDVGDRRSPRFKRRFTGEKGVGRLAAHKLAELIEVTSFAAEEVRANGAVGVHAVIDWTLVEKFETLDQLNESNGGAVVVESIESTNKKRSGTAIVLRRLRRKWSAGERTRFISEVQTFSPPAVLVERPSPKLFQGPVLFDQPVLRDTSERGTIFKTKLSGEFAASEDYWQVLVEAADWLIEIDAKAATKKVHYNIVPSSRFKREVSSAEQHHHSIAHPNPESGPFFQARILVRSGVLEGSRQVKGWASSNAGIRVFMEGFRVLPYGERANDWLSLDRDYSERARKSSWLEAVEIPDLTMEGDEDTFLSILPNRNYYGGVFLTEKGAPSLQMLVNREGFVPDAAYDALVTLLRVGIDLTTRARAAATHEKREERRETRRAAAALAGETEKAEEQEPEFRSAVQRAKSTAQAARRLVAEGRVEEAGRAIQSASSDLEYVSERLASENAMLRVLASVGTQMSAFIHEISSLMGMAEGVEAALDRLYAQEDLPRGSRQAIAKVQKLVGDLKRALERHASYLMDVVTPDARRRRKRIPFRDRFEAAIRLVEGAAERQGIRIVNEIPAEFSSPPMFPAELTTVFSNLLSNAVKAAGKEGTIRAKGALTKDGLTITIENSGRRVKIAEGERWFKPFESTTTTIDAVLGQGMGLGLPITRNMLEQYGAEIRFVEPSAGFATAVRLTFPNEVK